MLQSVRRAHLEVSDPMHYNDVNDFVYGDHGCVLEIMYAVNQAEAHLQQQTAHYAQLFSFVFLLDVGRAMGKRAVRF